MFLFFSVFFPPVKEVLDSRKKLYIKKKKNGKDRWRKKILHHIENFVQVLFPFSTFVLKK